MRKFSKLFFAAVMIGPGFTVSLAAFAQSGEKPSISGWLQNIPSAEGWRSLKWGTSIEELVKIYPNEIERLKKPERVIPWDPTFRSTFRARFKQKLPIDGHKYIVRFGFDDDGHLNYVHVSCYYVTKGKSFDEAFKAAVRTFTELLGEPGHKSEGVAQYSSAAYHIWEKSSIEIMLRFHHNFYSIGPISVNNDKYLIMTGRVKGTD